MHPKQIKKSKAKNNCNNETINIQTTKESLKVRL